MYDVPLGGVPLPGGGPEEVCTNVPPCITEPSLPTNRIANELRMLKPGSLLGSAIQICDVPVETLDAPVAGYTRNVSGSGGVQVATLTFSVVLASLASVILIDDDPLATGEIEKVGPVRFDRLISRASDARIEYGEVPPEIMITEC